VSLAVPVPTSPPEPPSKSASPAKVREPSSAALMVSHCTAYDTRSAKASSALVDWHQRALWPTLDSLGDAPAWLAAATARTPRTLRRAKGVQRVRPEYLHHIDLDAETV
jgi:hypothetical protein